MTLDDFEVWLEQRHLRALYVVNEDETRVYAEVLEKVKALREGMKKQLKREYERGHEEGWEEGYEFDR